MKRELVTCNNCGKVESVRPSRAKTYKHCSKSCFNKAQSTSKVYKRVCKSCGKNFNAKLDHGKMRQYCSRDCFGANKIPPQKKNCETCGNEFLATSSSHVSPDGLRKYCSNECRCNRPKTGKMRHCVHCGEEFYLTIATQKQRPNQSCCSVKCQQEHYIAEAAPTWKGGEYKDTTSNMKRIYIEAGRTKDGVYKPCKYLAEHRVIAADIIGRKLKRTEPILHINNDTMDNSPENLYICCSLSEMAKILQGSLDYPRTSNIREYK